MDPKARSRRAGEARSLPDEQRMQVGRTARWRDRRVPDAMRERDARPRVVDPEPASGQYFLVHARMKVAESAAELELLAVDGNRTKCRLDAWLRNERQVRHLGRQKPVHARPFELDEASHPLLLPQMNRHVGDGSEQPDQQVEEMNADIRDKAAGPLGRSFPRDVIPPAASRDIRQTYFMWPRVPLAFETCFERLQQRMKPQLQNRVHAASG